MLDKDQLKIDIIHMTCAQRYAHVMSAFEVASTAERKSSVWDDAIEIIKIHRELFKKHTKKITKL